MISGQLQATPSTTTTDVPATWCEPAETVPSPGKTSFEFVGSFLQDINVSTGLNRFLFEHDTEEAYIYISWGGDNPPKAIGRVRLASGTMGGEARTNLIADFTLPMTRKPDVEFGDATTSDVVEGGEEVTVLMTSAATLRSPRRSLSRREMRFTITQSGADLEALTADAVKALSKANRDVGRDNRPCSPGRCPGRRPRRRRGGLSVREEPGGGGRYSSAPNRRSSPARAATAVYLKARPARVLVDRRIRLHRPRHRTEGVPLR